MKYTGYLFVHFIGEQKDGEQIYFSLSRDGLHWNDLQAGQPMLRSGIGEKGARDPFLIRTPDMFYLIATDLRIEAGKGWETAQYNGSRDMLVWKSSDLVNWQGPKAHTIGVEGAGCVWAPEAVYDEEQDAALVFWASMVDGKQRIYASHTRDFENFTEAFLFLEKENHVIDSTIIRTEEGYYRYTKDETVKTICVDCSKTLHPEDFKEVKSDTLANLYGVEGPEIFRFNDRQEWCLIVDRFAEGKGYLPLVTDDLAGGEFRILKDSEFDMGQTRKRHGGVIPITEEEYRRLADKYGCRE
ncbi:MAG: glycoside hydrolase family 43 protein [Blautia sp.]|nr:glycoside hydrolase family 43 protein [Blautia sp.]